MELVKPPTKFSKRSRGLGSISIVRGVCWKRGADLFQGVAIFTYKKKSEMFNDKKKVYKQKYFALS